MNPKCFLIVHQCGFAEDANITYMFQMKHIITYALNPNVPECLSLFIYLRIMLHNNINQEDWQQILKTFDKPTQDFSASYLIIFCSPFLSYQFSNQSTEMLLQVHFHCDFDESSSVKSIKHL